jgi:hypothetical protein
MSEQDDAWNFAETVLKNAYPNAVLKGIVAKAQQRDPVNAVPVRQYVFLADFGGEHTSNVTAQRGAAGEWELFVINPPHKKMPHTLP